MVMKPKKKPEKKMGGGMVKKMRGGGMATKKMRGGGMVKENAWWWHG